MSPKIFKKKKDAFKLATRFHTFLIFLFLIKFCWRNLEEPFNMRFYSLNYARGRRNPDFRWEFGTYGGNSDKKSERGEKFTG